MRARGTSPDRGTGTTSPALSCFPLALPKDPSQRRRPSFSSFKKRLQQAHAAGSSRIMWKSWAIPQTKAVEAAGPQTTPVHAQAGGPRSVHTSQPKHLVMMVNGLFGTKENWLTNMFYLEKQMDMQQVMLHPSEANRRTDTFDGIDVCGQRLVSEIQTIVARNPSLERLTIIGHSMGGLLARYAVGILYDPTTSRIAGLEPCHFITIATPHLGCDAEGVSQVPFIGWLSVAPPLLQLFKLSSVPVASFLFGRTGRQFFLADEDMGRGPDPVRLPLLARMTQDVPQRNEYFYSALQSFASRTCYANTARDHLVGWANSSLRFMHSLPDLPPAARFAKGVVVEDPPLAAFDTRFKPTAEPQQAASRSDVPIDAVNAPGSAAWSNPSASFSAPGSLGALLPSAWRSASTSGREATFNPSADLMLGNPSWKAQQVEAMLKRLQRLPWRRIDVSFQGSLIPLAHNHIQVTRRWLNWEGDNVCAHLAALLRSTDQLYCEHLSTLGAAAANASDVPLDEASVHLSEGGSPIAARAKSFEQAHPFVTDDERERSVRGLES